MIQITKLQKYFPFSNQEYIYNNQQADPDDILVQTLGSC